MNKAVEKAIKILKNGGVVIFPTDTAFGIGCRIDDEKAVERLFKIRRRPETQAVPVLVDTVKMAQDYLLPIPQEAIDKLIEPYWPGALTIILPSIVAKVPKLVRGGGETLGVRIPNHSVARALIRGVGIPILGPSANFYREKTPYKMEDLDPTLVGLVDFVLAGEYPLGCASTVIDCSTKPWKILRQGALRLRASTELSRMSSGQANLTVKKVLLIDTTSSQEIKVGLRINGKEYVVKHKVDYRKAQVVLPLINKIIKENNLELKNLSSIEVNVKEGSFTGVRVGLSVANALGFALKIPVKKVV